ncbi:MAG: hypothetical protein L0Z55_11755 [Planctomycetes bacterium]|nr:hypothetical protein [Planctomycetota bacterium]
MVLSARPRGIAARAIVAARATCSDYVAYAICVLCAVCSACAARAPAPPPIVLHFAPPAPGDARESLRTARVRLQVTRTLGSEVVGESTLVRTTRERERTEILAVAGGRASRMSVAYALAEEAEEGGARAPRALPVSGKSYEVSLENGNVRAVRADGGEVAGAELAHLGADWRQFSLDGGYAAYFEGKEFARGAVYQLTEKESPALPLALGENLRVPVYKLIARGVREACGEECLVFDAALRMTSESPAGERALLDLNGEILISRARGWIVALRLAGRFESRTSIVAAESAPLTTAKGEVTFELETISPCGNRAP